MALVRYQVVGGQETQHVQVPVRMILHNGRPYRIQQDVDDQGFTTSIENEVVDFWTDDRLRTGGVGFFGGKGDTPHLYWMRVTHHDDFLGKVCATIAPNN
jgi:anti-sigma regulatory factor (Ser/Thr protein kinase)